MSSSEVISELAHNEELLNAYKEFEKMTGEFYPNTAIGLDDRLNSFYKYKDLIKGIIQSGKQDELKDNVLLMLRDQEFKTTFQYDQVEAIKGIRVDTVEQLANYDKVRDYMFYGFIKDDTTSINEYVIKALIKMKYFGNIDFSAAQYNKYDHKKFLKDYLKFNSCELNESEVDLVELYSMIEECKTPDELRRLSDFLADRKEINPVRMKYIDRKVVENYKQEYVDFLLNVEDAQKMVEDPSNASYLGAIYKKNGDTIYRDGILKNDGTYIGKDYVRLKDGTVIKEYDANNADYGLITSKSKADITTLNFTYKGDDNEVTIRSWDEAKKIESMKLALPRDMNVPSSRRIEILVEPIPGEYMYGHYYNTMYTYRIYSEDESKYYECKLKENNDTKEFPIRFYREVDALSGQEILSKSDSEISKFEALTTFCNKAEQYIDNMEQAYLEYAENLEKATPVQKYNTEKEMTLEEGDIPSYVVYDVEPRRLCISAQRGFTFNEPDNKLMKNKLIKNTVEPGTGKYKGTIQQRLNIEKYLEGGISTRSCYFGCIPYNFEVGIGMADFDTNCIVGFNEGDAMTSHTPKTLRPSMNSAQVSPILDGLWGTHAEIALHRYEPDIANIKPGNSGGRVKPEYIFQGHGIYGGTSKYAEKYAREFKVPLINFEYSSPEKYKELGLLSKKSVLEEREPRRTRQEGEIVLQARKILFRDVERDESWETFFESIDEQVSEMPDSVRKKNEAIRQIRFALSREKDKQIDTDKPEIE